MKLTFGELTGTAGDGKSMDIYLDAVLVGQLQVGYRQERSNVPRRHKHVPDNVSAYVYNKGPKAASDGFDFETPTVAVTDPGGLTAAINKVKEHVRLGVFPPATAAPPAAPPAAAAEPVRGPVSLAGTCTDLGDDRWNTFHDWERAVLDALHDYSTAASYSGCPGQDTALHMVELLKTAQTAMDAVNAALRDAVVAEVDFVKAHGTPNDYTTAWRNRIFRH